MGDTSKIIKAKAKAGFTAASDGSRHFFHLVSNVRPVIWMGVYLALIPIFALIYNWIPHDHFRIPSEGGVGYGSWLYYSIVTITTLGFGDYTPITAGAQAATCIEVGCGLLVMGFFLNAVGSMKSEIDVSAEIEKQRRLHEAQETDKLLKNIPLLLRSINVFLDKCDAYSQQAPGSDPHVLLVDVLKNGSRTALLLDSLQNKVDIALWPDLLENCFGFVADYQMFSSEDPAAESTDMPVFIDRTRRFALQIEKDLTAVKAAET